MDALLAIKPEYADKILAGDKGYEFRRKAFRSSEDVDLIFLYSSSPVKRIVGLFTSDRVIEATPDELWELFGDESGIDDRDKFMKYFEGVDTGYAIKVSDTYRFDESIDPKNLFEDYSVPMSFQYLSPAQEELLRKRIPDFFSNRTKETNLSNFSPDQ